MLAMTTLDEEMLDDIQKIAPPEPAEPEPVFQNPFNTHKADYTFSYGYGIPANTGNKTPPFGSSSPYAPKSPEQSKTPEYQASSPVYRPSSPVYQPSSPVYGPSSPKQSLPAKQPSSPPYRPESPYAPSPKTKTDPISLPTSMVLEEGEVDVKPTGKSLLKGLLNKINGIKENDL
jgi:hypothetical protein